MPDIEQVIERLDEPLENSPMNGGPRVAMTLREWLTADTRVPHKRARQKALDLIEALSRETDVTPEMIEAGIDARQKLLDAMTEREASPHPEDLPDYDEGDVMREIYLAMDRVRTGRS